MKLLKNENYFRNMIFGAEDSLVSTVGVLFGIATGTEDTILVIFTGIIVIAVEALSMGAGSYLSESSAQEMLEESKKPLEPKNVSYTKDNTINNNNDAPVIDGLIMFISYFVSGFIPLAPYALFPVSEAKYLSIFCSLISLFLLGYLPHKKVKSAIRMLVVAGCAIGIGFLISHLFNAYLIYSLA